MSVSTPAGNAVPSGNNQKEKQTFLFDIIVTQLEALGENITDSSKLIVDSRFNGIPVRMTSSCINVADFVNQRSIEFSSTTAALRKSMKDGLKFAVQYGSKAIGNGHIDFPSDFIDGIEQNMSDLMHEDMCDLESRNQISGILKFKCRLLIKCEDSDKGDGICPRDIDKRIRPQDIFFVLGEPEVCAIPSHPCEADLESEEGEDRLRLDLSRYRTTPNSRVEPTDMMVERPEFSAACYELKKLVAEYGEVIETVNKTTGNLADAQPPCFPQSDPTIEVKRPPPQNRERDEEVSYENILPGRHDLAPLNPIRFCPVCLANMSWLPKFAACMKCGIKPTPELDKRLREKRPTIEEILAEYLVKPSNDIDNQCLTPCEIAFKRKIEGCSEDSPPCRCKCKENKICAHCRIRKVCDDIFQASKNEKVCPKVEPEENEDFCIVTESSDDCRPCLARVFSELRYLYGVHDKRNSEYDLLCGGSNKWGTKNPCKARILGGQEEELVQNSSSSERHKHCVRYHGSIPGHHGWAWTKSYEARRYGWRPGAIRKPIKKIMKFFLEPSPEALAEEFKENELPEPVLNVCKRNGEIFITLRALSTLGMKQNPIVYRLVKSDFAEALSAIKAKLKSKGFKKCTCHNTVVMCHCRNIIEKKQLEHAIRKECRKRHMPTCADHLILTDTSESEMEYDFNVTPPAGTRRSTLFRKRRTTDHGTQTSKWDMDKLSVPRKYPLDVNPYSRPYDCARYKTKAVKRDKPRKTNVQRGI